MIEELRGAIKPFIKKDTFSAIDWGAAEGLVGIGLAADFPDSTILLVEKDKDFLYKELALANSLKTTNAFICEKNITPDLIDSLYNNNNDIFDYQFALNILHHMWGSTESWEDQVRKVLRLAIESFVILPEIGSKGGCARESVLPETYRGRPVREVLEDLSGGTVTKLLDWPSGFGLRHLYHVKPADWIRATNVAPGVTYTLQKKGEEIYIERQEKTESKSSHGYPKKYKVPGVTLRLPIKMNCIYPDRELLIKRYQECNPKPDPSEVNILFSGKKCVFIDDLLPPHPDYDTMVNTCIRKLREPHKEAPWVS
jgi:hypothetical protein